MHQEQRNDRVKLAHHRLVARALARNPALLDEARAVVAAWQAEAGHPAYVDDWAALLARPASVVRREITRRSPEATRLRLSSPFALTPTKVMSAEQIDRLWKTVGRALSAR